MSAQFEAEIRNSILSLKGAVASLSTETERANSSMRSLGAATHVAATGAEDVGRKGAMSMETMAKGATRAGGEMGKAFGLAGAALGGLNPIALGVGLGVGFITTKVFELIQALGQAGEEAARMNAAVEAAPGLRRSKDAEVAMNANTKKLRDRFTETPEIGLNAAQRAKAKEMMDNDMPVDAIVAEMNNMMPSDTFGKRQITSEAAADIRHKWNRNYSNDNLNAVRNAETRQEAARLGADQSEMDAIRRNSGLSASGARSRADELTESSPALSAELSRLTKALQESTDALKKERAAGGLRTSMWDTSAENGLERSKAALEEFNSRVERQVAKDY